MRLGRVREEGTFVEAFHVFLKALHIGCAQLLRSADDLRSVRESQMAPTQNI
jgi:hypothetical protein